MPEAAVDVTLWCKAGKAETKGLAGQDYAAAGIDRRGEGDGISDVLLTELDLCGAVVAERPDWDRSAVEGRVIIASADAAEGMRAFAEKRAPRWQGK